MVADKDPDYRREARYQGTPKSKHAYLSFIAFLGILVQTGALDEPNIAVFVMKQTIEQERAED